MGESERVEVISAPVVLWMRSEPAKVPPTIPALLVITFPACPCCPSSLDCAQLDVHAAPKGGPEFCCNQIIFPWSLSRRAIDSPREHS